MIQTPRTTTLHARMQLRVSIAMATVWLIQTKTRSATKTKSRAAKTIAACNYDATATDAGYCDYPETNYDCDGNCLNDSDQDGICDALEVEGCTTPSACNYNAAATEADGSCTFAEPVMTATAIASSTWTTMDSAI